MSGAVEIVNIDDVLARLSRLPDVAQREVAEALREVASTNAARIRADAPGAGRQAALASLSVTASGQEISGGGPFFLGSVFGGQGRPTTQQFKPYVGGDGYWFFTSLAAAFPDTIDRLAQVVDAIAREWEG